MAILEYTPRSKLYHYCNESGFIGILKSRSLWLSDLSAANDPKELHFSDKIREVITRFATQTKNKRLAEASLRSEKIIERASQRSSFYTFSLSTAKDILPMWQEYTNRGRGYCIEFRATAFNDMPVRIQKVRYVEGFSDDNLASELERVFYSDAIMESDVPIDLGIAVRLLSLLTSVKHKTWQHEKEVRLAVVSEEVVHPS